MHVISAQSSLPNKRAWNLDRPPFLPGRVLRCRFPGKGELRESGRAFQGVEGIFGGTLWEKYGDPGTGARSPCTPVLVPHGRTGGSQEEVPAQNRRFTKRSQSWELPFLGAPATFLGPLSSPNQAPLGLAWYHRYHTGFCK